MSPIKGTLVILVALIFWSCGQDKETSATSGGVVVHCDESVYPVVKIIAEDFLRTYTDARIEVISLDGREAIANLLNDSVRVIVSGRELNQEEKDFAERNNIELQSVKVALDGIAVISHKGIPQKEMRLSELDSILAGKRTSWSSMKSRFIELALGSVDASTTEILKTGRLDGGAFSPTARRFPSSRDIVQFVRSTPNGMGLVGIAWLRSGEEDVNVLSLGSPGSRPDSTQPFGRYYSPAQAHIYRKYYPLTRTITAYTREYNRNTVGYGFISYMSGGQGQKLFLNEGLVPQTMPVRLVETSSTRVN